MAANPVVYLLPGLLCDETVWKNQAAELSEFMDVRIPVFRGMNSFRDMALKVLAEAPERFSVVGHSMGGRVAMELMHLAPERIEHFIVMDLGVHPVQPGEHNQRMVLVHVGEQLGMEALAELWIPPMISPRYRDNETLIGEIREMVLRSSPDDYRGQIEAALNREDQTGYLPLITHKVLVVCGAEDEWSPVAQHEEIVATLPNAKLQIIPEAGHMVTMENPEAVNKVLSDWLRS